jgi:GH25 family lysozyme M1 (1,4-beta-N-acetylmuramidase)
MTVTPKIADMYYRNEVNLTALAAGGMWAVIHKCSQGPGFHDPSYLKRQAIAKSFGLLWGGYDFSTSDDPVKNADDFLAHANLGPADAACLDFEDNSVSNMTGDQAYAWMDHVAQKLGRAPIIYGGNHISDYPAGTRHPRIDPQDKKWIDAAKVWPLWRCRYLNRQFATNADLFKVIGPIPPWTECGMIQYAADGAGPQPHQVPGVQNGADLNAFLGTRDQLALLFAGKPGWDQAAPAAVA